MEFGGKPEKDGLGLEELMMGLVVRVAASLALRASVKQDATRCMESPRGVTTRFRWCKYLLANMYSSFATASAQANRR